MEGLGGNNYSETAPEITRLFPLGVKTLHLLSAENEQPSDSDLLPPIQAPRHPLYSWNKRL